MSRTQIDLYHRRALSPAELLAVDDHVQVCEACRIELARGEPLDAALAAWATILGNVKEGAPPSSRRRGWRRSLTARPGLAVIIAALLLACLVGLIAIALCRVTARLHHGQW